MRSRRRIRTNGAAAPTRDPTREEALRRAHQLLAEAEALRTSGSPDEALAAVIDYEQAARLAGQARDGELFGRARLGKALALRGAGHPLASSMASHFEEEEPANVAFASWSPGK